MEGLCNHVTSVIELVEGESEGCLVCYFVVFAAIFASRERLLYLRRYLKGMEGED